MRAPAVMLVLIALTSNVLGDGAATAIKDADKLKKAGKVADACELLAATDKAEPDDDVKLALAACYADLGRLGSAWHLYTALGKTDKADKLAKRAAKLTVEVTPDVRVRIFAGTLDMSAALEAPTPIDAGEVELAVSAPGYAVWRKTVELVEGETTTIPIALKKRASIDKIDPNDPDAPEPETIDSIERPVRYSPFIHEIAISAEAGFMFTPQAYRLRARAAYSYSSVVDVALVAGTRGNFNIYPFEYGAGIDLRGTIPFGNFCRPFAHVEASAWSNTSVAINVGGGLACRAWRSGDGPQLYFAVDGELGDGPSYGMMVGVGKAIVDKR